MQPKQTMKKTLLASALILGLGNAFHASSDVFPVSAGAVSDVDITQHPSLGDAEISFGDRIKLNPTANSKCILVGATNAFEDEINVNLDVSTDDADEADKVTSATSLTDGSSAVHAPGDIADDSTGCLGDATTGGSSGAYMVLEVTGTPGTTVSVSIPNVDTGDGWEYVAGNQTCVVDYDGTVGADTCVPFTGITSVAGVGLSKASASETVASADFTENNEGQTHILLAGELIFDGTALTAGAVSETITVTVTYE